MTKYLTAIATAIILSACQSTTALSNANTNPADTQKVWQLSQFQNFSNEQLQNTSMDWSKLPHVSAYMGCNRINFQATLDGKGGLSVSSSIATRMYCADTMALEDQFSQNIHAMKHYRVENNVLILNDGAGKEMRFIEKK